MIGIKKLDWFVLKNFALVFAGSFFICLFVFMMQSVWSSVEDLVGKGLLVTVLAKFFWYMGLALIPTALPLAVLLASLISFGNMSERLELLAMKAAGVPLIRIMAPLIVVVLAMGGLSFYFQNVTSPKAQIKLRTLMFSIKQTSPALEIPEGIFYTGVPNVNLYVERKNSDTNMLYGVIIYKTDQGFEKAQIVLADSGRLEMTADRLYLKLKLYSGEQFENLQAQNMSSLQANVPYDRETFDYKELLIEFDSSFKEMDASSMNRMEAAKNMKELVESIDSMNFQSDSIGASYYKEIRHQYFSSLEDAERIRGKQVSATKAVKKQQTADFDSLWQAFAADKQLDYVRRAENKVAMLRGDLEWKQYATSDTDYRTRRHWIQWHQKMTLSLACIIFFFVGAPLGAIIRKGGLGLSTIISVGFFIFYYLFNTSGMKLARDGSWEMWYGMWISTFVLVPMGVFLTIKANRDSTLFNIEEYKRVFRKLFGLRITRHIFRKEVIIDDPRYAEMREETEALALACQEYAVKNKLQRMPSYVDTFFHSHKDHEVEELSERLEAIVAELGNSRDGLILNELNKLPVLVTHAHVSPFDKSGLNLAAGVLFPVGLVLWLRMWRFRLRLYRDLKQIEKSCAALCEHMDHMNKID